MELARRSHAGSPSRFLIRSTEGPIENDGSARSRAVRWMQGPQTGGVAATPASAMADPNRMPGLATNRQLARLAAAKGKAFDRLFLILMLRHHEGGIEMANYAVEHASRPQVRAAAGSMVIDQTNECTLIEELLKADQRHH